MWHISIHTFVSQEFSSVSAFTTAMLLLFSGLHLFDQAISISRTGWILVKPWQTCKLVLLVSVSRALVILLLWCVCVCVQERKMLIERCQEIASAQCIRFSFLSGDVHVCAAGRLYSDPKVRSPRPIANFFSLSKL